jgi:hypothetical protein
LPKAGADTEVAWLRATLLAFLDIGFGGIVAKN